MKNNKTIKIIIINLTILMISHLLLIPITYCQDSSNYIELIKEMPSLKDYTMTKECPSIIKDNIKNKSIDSPWPMFMQGAKHTGRSPYTTTNNEGLIKWTFWTDFGIDTSPAIDKDGIIYISSKDDYLYALYPNGIEKWRIECGDYIESSPAIGSDGTIYVGSTDEYLYSINPDGTLKWRFYTENTVKSSPSIDENGIIYFGVLGPGSDVGRIHALYPNGTEKWHFNTNFWIYTSPAIGNDGTIYVTSKDNNIYALYPDNGTCKWSYGFGDWPGDPSIAEDGTIYIASYDDNLYALYPNGTQRWEHAIDWGTCNAPAIDEDGTIYIGQKYLYAINPDGTRKWTYEPGDEFEVTTSCAISSDGTIYFGVTRDSASGGDIIAVDSNGNEKWRKVIAGNWVLSSPAIGSDGTVYIGSQSNEGGDPYGLLYAFGDLDPNAPNAPVISGETEGQIGEVYDYTFMSTDPQGKDVFYYIEWGDDVEGWIGPYASGEEITLSHSWSAENTYLIKARAKNPDNLWGPWGELEVTMPIHKPIQYYGFPMIQKILDHFPNAFPILRQILCYK